MAEVKFSNAAEADLIEIDEFSVARFGEEVAETCIHGFDAAFVRLRDHPLAAPLSPDVGDGFHCLVQRQHRILYTAIQDRILVARILHDARDVRRALKGTAGRA